MVTQPINEYQTREKQNILDYILQQPRHQSNILKQSLFEAVMLHIALAVVV